MPALSVAARLQEISVQLVKDRVRVSTLEADVHLSILRTHDCIGESRALIARLNAEELKLTTF